MKQAIVKKELREAGAYAAVAVALSAVYVCRQIGLWSRLLSWSLGWIPGLREQALLPFVDTEIDLALGFIGIALAVTLGLRQSTWDVTQGRATYLLHLPVSRQAFFLTKISSGIGLVLASMLLPILAYATWAAWPGSHPAPFEWSMLDAAMRMGLLLPLVYLGAFASGIRPARWFGSRLFPLLAAAIPAVLFHNVSWFIGLPLSVLFAAAFINNILLDAATRDF